MGKEKKIFVLDSTSGETIKLILEKLAEEIGLNLKVYNEQKYSGLPRGYDVYILHLSETTFEAIETLQRKQPESRFVAISGNNIGRLRKRQKYLIDWSDKEFNYHKLLKRLKYE